MPFTPSHAVVALPFVRTPLQPAAIAVGAMTPDLPLFVRAFGPDYTLTHDLRWIPVTALIALALLLVWRGLLRPAARELSPRWLAVRLPGEWDAGPVASVGETFAQPGAARPSVRGALLLAVSLALGVATHIVWDMFTHEGRWGSRVLPILDDQWGPLVGYKWLQHGSSVIGLMILAGWAFLWLRRATTTASVERTVPATVRRLWWASLPVMLLCAWISGLFVYGPLTPEWTPTHLAYRVLPPACGIWGALTVVLCVVVQRARLRRRA